MSKKQDGVSTAIGQPPEEHKEQRRHMLRSIVAGAGLAAMGGVGIRQALAAPPPTKTNIDTPVISCGASSPVTIRINVKAGATGLPAGFSLQWMTVANYEANGDSWYMSDDPRLCKASFSGNAHLSRYDLAANESVTVDIGEMLFDNGASTNCPDALVCGTAYVFRAFGHATNKLKRSSFTANLTCTTSDCNGGEGCTYTQGYWKTHGPIPTGNNVNKWPVASLMLGSVSYTDFDLLMILNQPAMGNGLTSMAHQLIAAKLNVANGSNPTDAAAAIADADALIGGLFVPPIGAGSLAPAATSALTTTLANYNEGTTGPGHCD